MDEQKRFFWIKLKTDFFQEDSPIDFLLSQKNGSEYVVLYIKLCLMTANGNGRLQKQIGEMIVPYDVDKIARDMKYFSRDTVIVALELYKKLGLVYQELDGTLVIANHTALVGSESASRDAIKKRNQRQRAKEIAAIEEREGDNEGDKGGTNCLTEYRDKSIEIRDKRLETREQSLDTRYQSTDNSNQSANADVICETQSVSLDVKEVAEAWNDLQGLGIKPVSKMSASSTRYKALSARIREHGKDKVLEAIENIKVSNFLQGMNDKGWIITFDWFAKPNNFVKVLDGNYSNRVTREQEKKGDDRYDGIRKWAERKAAENTAGRDVDTRAGNVVENCGSAEDSVPRKGFFGF